MDHGDMGGLVFPYPSFPGEGFASGQLGSESDHPRDRPLKCRPHLHLSPSLASILISDIFLSLSLSPPLPPFPPSPLLSPSHPLNPGNASDVCTKYQEASKIVNLTLEGIATQCLPGAKVLDICQFGTTVMESQTSKLYNKKSSGVAVEKGVAFPVCISVNDVICNRSPLSSEELVSFWFFFLLFFSGQGCFRFPSLPSLLVAVAVAVAVVVAVAVAVAVAEVPLPGGGR